MDPHAHDPHAHATPAAPAVRDPDWNWWLGATLLFLAVLLGVFALPAARAGHRDVQPAPAAARDARSEQDRAADLLASLSGLGIADDSVPPEVADQIRYLIRRVAESGATFVRDDVESSATATAEWMMQRWKNATSPIYSAETFIRRVAGYKLVDRLTIRVKLPDGTDKSLHDWMNTQLIERPAGH